MTPPFLLLLLAAGIFRWLSVDSMRLFRSRLALLLPRKVMSEHLRILMKDYPGRLSDFRRRVLPFSALHLVFNVAACAAFAAAIWYFPPVGMEQWDLRILQYGSLLLIPIAFVFDAVAFIRTFLSTFAREAEIDEAV